LPPSAQRFWIASFALLALGCTDADGPGGTPPAGALSGELVVEVADFEHHAETRYLLRPASGEERPLLFARAPAIPPGARVHVWGNDDGEALRVLRIEEEPAAAVQRGALALIDAPQRRNRRWAFVLVDVGGGVNLTRQAAQERVFSLTNPASTAYFYREASYGIQGLEGQVFGPLSYQPVAACDSMGASRALRAMVPAGFDQYLWYFGSRMAGCRWTGTGTLGNAERPARDSWYNGASRCTTLIQEPGHNFGMLHSSAMRCTAGGTPVPFAVPPMANCTHSEYGNPFDPMGSGCFHMNGYQKAHQDWLAGCNIVKATTSGTFTIYPLEKPCNGVQLLQVPMPGPRIYSAVTTGIPERETVLLNYFVELRAPIGLDSQLSGPTVLVTIGGDIKDAARYGGRNWLLDMKPETASRLDSALSVGQTFSDPDARGPKITLVSADASKALVRIQLAGAGPVTAPGQGVCDDMTPFTAPGAESCEAAPPAVRPDGGSGDGGSADAGTSARDGGAGDSARDTAAAPDTPPASADAREAASPDSGLPPDMDSDIGAGGGRAGAGGSPTPRPEAGAAGGVTAGGACACQLGSRGDGGASLPLLFAAVAALVPLRRRRHLTSASRGSATVRTGSTRASGCPWRGTNPGGPPPRATS
jgi:hypothetical protein